MMTAYLLGCWFVLWATVLLERRVRRRMGAERRWSASVAVVLIVVALWPLAVPALLCMAVYRAAPKE